MLGGGDVKYHMGATGDFTAGERPQGGNASGFESQPPGSGRSGGDGPHARQADAAREQGRQQVFAITMHGDAAFAGQGIWAETLNMSGVPGYHGGRIGAASS